MNKTDTPISERAKCWVDAIGWCVPLENHESIERALNASRAASDEIKKQLAAKTAQCEAFDAALNRSPYDISPCMKCGLPVVCLPDGMPVCEACAQKEGGGS